jgi:hypothetical protein
MTNPNQPEPAKRGPYPTTHPEPARPIAPPRPTKGPTRVDDRREPGFRFISARAWTPDLWPLPNPEQMDTLRRLLPPVSAEASEAA